MPKKSIEEMLKILSAAETLGDISVVSPTSEPICVCAMIVANTLEEIPFLNPHNQCEVTEEQFAKIRSTCYGLLTYRFNGTIVLFPCVTATSQSKKEIVRQFEDKKTVRNSDPKWTLLQDDIMSMKHGNNKTGLVDCVEIVTIRLTHEDKIHLEVCGN